ncbi:DinB family protein [Aestuariivivens sediminicola]|uniref:DinB family protein n=1 Tax=Aestuariivivens sediminicola TaxID=2913560 RepID=UPI001F56C288|nr:DinB family protein [Aestuariivivens sediminicola]
METTLDKLEHLLTSGVTYLSNASKQELTQKVNPKKWSKKEIRGHLIDSGIHNLQRFTEIQYEPKPYHIRPYNQDALVKANNYQNAHTMDLINFWQAINHRIMDIMRQQTQETLNYKIELPNGSVSDLAFLMTDYVDHLEHHQKQILNNQKL